MAILAVITGAYYLSRASHTLLFWLAFVLIRPLGATLGDILTRTHEKGGLDLGTIGSSIVLGICLVGCGILLTRLRPAVGESTARAKAGTDWRP